MNQDDFDSLLEWLDPDREQAGKKYETIRRGLIRYFIYRGCLDGEDLADETINRVARKVKEIAPSYVGDPVRYFHGVARNVCREKCRPAPPPPPPPLPDTPDEKIYDCLEECLDKLPPEDREIILGYYRQKGQAKIDLRKEMAGRLGMTPNALRIKLYRIRAVLEKCMDDCPKQEDD